MCSVCQKKERHTGIQTYGEFMNALLQAVVGDSLSAPARSFSLAVLYDDIETHEHATTVYESLLRELPDSAQLTGAWWRTSLLTDLQLARVAARSAATADLVMVSVHTEREPPLVLKFWFDSWPRQGSHPAALVGLLHPDGGPGAAEEWDCFLKDVAQRRGMLYLPGAMSAPSEPESSTRLGLREIEPYTHWGLNE
jgi:hypothetical protein